MRKGVPQRVLRRAHRGVPRGPEQLWDLWGSGGVRSVFPPFLSFRLSEPCTWGTVCSNRNDPWGVHDFSSLLFSSLLFSQIGCRSGSGGEAEPLTSIDDPLCEAHPASLMSGMSVSSPYTSAMSLGTDILSPAKVLIPWAERVISSWRFRCPAPMPSLSEAVL